MLYNLATTLRKGLLDKLSGSASDVLLGDGTFGRVPAVTTVTNTLGADVALNNIANYFTGPSCAQGTSGTWFASGSIVVLGTAGDQCLAKLWDGTTVIASTFFYVVTPNIGICHLSGVLASPAGNIKISVRDATSNTAVIAYNTSGLGKDCTLTVMRIG